MSDTSSTENDDFGNFGDIGAKKYPVHDCCELGDAESLRRLIFVRQDASDEDENEHSDDIFQEHSSSKSDDSNNSRAETNAEATGRLPYPIPDIRSNELLDVSSPPVNTVNVTAGGDHGNRPKIINACGAIATTTAFDKENKEKESPQRAAIMTGEEAAIDKRKNDVKEENQQRGNFVSTTTKNTAPASSETTAGSTVPETEEQRKNVSTSLMIRDETFNFSNDTKSKHEPNHHNSKSNDAILKKQELQNMNRTKQLLSPKKSAYFCPYDLNERDQDENTPLHVAILFRKLEHVKLLIEAGSSVHKKCDGSAPIHTCISLGAIPMHADFAYECTVILAENGADLSIRDDCQHTPLYLACMANLPRVVGYILTRDSNTYMLNARADRMGGRALHAAARYDSGARHHAINLCPNNVHHPDSTPRPQSKCSNNSSKVEGNGDNAPPRKEITMVTQLLLETPGIEVDAKNSYGQTPLHVACARGNWSVARLMLRFGSNPNVTDRRGFTPGHVAQKRGIAIPNDLLSVLGDALTQTRDLVVDPIATTLICCHELCSLHRSCPPIRRDSNSEPPPENVRRLHVLINEHVGILRAGEFAKCTWNTETRRAAITDILKIHEYTYVERIGQLVSAIPDHPSAIAHLDADTTVSRWSFEAAMRAAGSVCEAVDKVVSGDFRNAFCAVRPPGHHAGPRGIVQCANDPDGGSHGFCLLNNIAIGAAYARSMYRNHGIRKIAIIDFDVHHGNGTEEVIRQLIPTQEKAVVQTPFASGELLTTNYRPWLDESDVNNVFFASTHGYGPRNSGFSDHPSQCGWFYPASGKTHTTDAISNPTNVDLPNLADFLLSQTWTRFGEESRLHSCKIINCGLSLPQPDAVPGMQRVELRDTYREKVFPHLRDFDPDIIFISAGFDAHKRDSMNFGYVGMVEDDYEWVTEQLVRIANTCCNGRIVSVLEGGYKIQGGIISPFARSVASHVRALVDGGLSRELYNPADGEWDSQFERHTVEERERRRQQKLEKLNKAAEETRRELYGHGSVSDFHAGSAEMEVKGSGYHAAAESQVKEQPDHDPQDKMEEKQLNNPMMNQPARKRRRNQVDYKALYEQMKQEEA